MKCMLLAAGRGERLRPITDHTPKPLVKVAGVPLVDYHLSNLKAAGIHEVVINLSHLGEQIENYLGDGERYGMNIQFSHEGDEPLETAGGIIHALPLLGEHPFLVMNSDIWCDHPLSFASLSDDKLAHLVLVNNPKHNSEGDFVYEFGKVYNTGKNTLTFSGIGIYHPTLFKGLPSEKSALAPILRDAIDKQQVSAEYFSGNWFDSGTEARLEEIEKFVRNNYG